MPPGYSLVDCEGATPEPSEGSGTLQLNLSDLLGTAEVRTRLWYLAPGDALVYHRHERQEELYFVVDGPGRLNVDGELIDVPTGAAVRVSPDTPRQLFNDTDHDHAWLVVGSPPVERDGLHDVGPGVTMDAGNG